MNAVDLSFLHTLVDSATTVLIPLMVGVFLLAFLLRVLIYITVRRESWFVREFDKRVHRHLANISHENNISYFTVLREIFYNTYSEIFSLRAKYGRRGPDQVMSIYDRLFLVAEGAGRVILEFLRQARYFKHKETPRFIELSKAVFQSNPPFSKVFGIFNIGFFNNFINVLPGIFVVCGIFGTFIGIMNGLPGLSGIDVSNPELSKQIMDSFLGQVAFAMNSSLVGIFLSVCMTFLNIGLSPEDAYLELIDRFTLAMEVLWNRCDHNEFSEKDKEFMQFQDRLNRELGLSLSTSKQYEFDRQVLEHLRSQEIDTKGEGHNVA